MLAEVCVDLDVGEAVVAPHADLEPTIAFADVEVSVALPPWEHPPASESGDPRRRLASRDEDTGRWS